MSVELWLLPDFNEFNVAETEFSDKQVWPNSSTYSINESDSPPNELDIPSTQSSGSAYKI